MFPRFSVFPGHEHKAFIPYSSIFKETKPRLGRRKAPQQPKSDAVPLKQSRSKNKNNSGTATPVANGHSTPSTNAQSPPPNSSSEIERAIINAAEEPAEDGDTSDTREPTEMVEVSDLVNEKLHISSADDGDSVSLPESELEEEDGAYARAEPHLVVHGTVVSITDKYVTVRDSNTAGKADDDDWNTENEKHMHKPKHLWSIDTVDIPYSHLIYALGSHMPDPLRLDVFTKEQGVDLMRRAQERIKQSKETIIIGGGALGVQMASDIASLYNGTPNAKKITLIHSRKQLLPNFDPKLHDVALKKLKELGVEVVLGQRLALTQGCPLGSGVKDVDSKSNVVDPTEASSGLADGLKPAKTDGADTIRHRIRTTHGLELECDLLLMCTGQRPNTSIMAEFSPSSVDPGSRLIRVLPTLQVMVPHDAESAQRPFDVVPPCKDCDCFADKKTSWANGSLENGSSSEAPDFLENVYAIGDCVDAFGAINAGYQAWFMGETAAENVLRDICRSRSADEPGNKVPESEPVPLKHFHPGPPMIKLTLGKEICAVQAAPTGDSENPDEPKTVPVTLQDSPEDMMVEAVWANMALADPSNMHV